MKKYQNKEWLYQKYVVEKLSTLQIADLLDVNSVTIWNWLKKFGIPTRSLSEAHKNQIPWIKGRKHTKETKRKMSIAHLRDKSYRWRGGKHTKEKGYIKVFDITHLRSDSKGYVYEHIIIWEKYWRESVPRGYIIHHVDKNPSNNHICNLALVTVGFHLKIHRYANHPGGTI